MSYGWDDDTGQTSTGMGSGGHDYSSARKAYKSSGSGFSGSGQSSAGRSKASISSGKAPVGKIIKSAAKNIIACRFDVTGSNTANADIFFNKLPLLFKEAKRYLPNLKISFGVNGDAYTDDHPLQIRDFASGPALDTELNALYPEGNGGGQGKETYELIGYYDLKRCEIPNAVNPFWFLLCDEGFYPEVMPDHVQNLMGIDMPESMNSVEVFHQIMQKFNAYVLRCKYGQGMESQIHRQWVDTFGPDRVLLLEDPARVVDVMLGLIAIDTGHDDDYSKRLSSRQTSAQVKSVNKSLRSKTIASQANNSGKSQTKKSGKSKSLKSKKLV